LNDVIFNQLIIEIAIGHLQIGIGTVRNIALECAVCIAADKGIIRKDSLIHFPSVVKLRSAVLEMEQDIATVVAADGTNIFDKAVTGCRGNGSSGERFTAGRADLSGGIAV